MAVRHSPAPRGCIISEARISDLVRVVDHDTSLVVHGHITHPPQGVRTRERFDQRVNQFGGYEIVFAAD